MDLENVKITERELEMAFTLIELLRKPFDPEEYKRSLPRGAGCR